MATVAELQGYDRLDGGDEFAAILSESLSPRGPEMLVDLFAELEPRPGELVLEIGGRDGGDVIQLVERFDVRVLMVDPEPSRLQHAASQIKSLGLGGRVSMDLGEIERLPLVDRSIDQVWCRDALTQVNGPKALTECARVLNRGGGMLVHQTFATSLLEPNEAARLFSALAINPESMSSERFETAAMACGFEIVKKDVIGGEWREQWVESGESTLVDDLLAITRMRRTRTALVTHFGETPYEVMLGRRLWGVYQILGKLQPTAYLLRKQIV